MAKHRVRKYSICVVSFGLIVFAVLRIDSFMSFYPSTVHITDDNIGIGMHKEDPKFDEPNLKRRQNLTGRYVVTNMFREANSSFVRSSANMIDGAIKIKNGITSAIKTTYEIINSNYDNGDPYKYVHVRITAKDGMNNQRLGGGDLWTAVMASDEFRTSGHIVDHENGTYSVFFVKAWKGEAKLNITLIYPSSATRYYQTHIWPEFRLQYQGTFQRGAQKEITLCTVLSSSEIWLEKTKCVYMSKTSLGHHVFTCDVPMNLSCNALIHYGHGEGSGLKQINVMTDLLRNRTALFKGVYTTVSNGPKQVNLLADQNSERDTTSADGNNSLSSGFWNKSVWVSFNWENVQYEDSQSVGDCLRDKHVYFMGDSTMNQLFRALCKLFNIHLKIRMDTDDDHAGAPRRIYVEDYNTTLYFMFHHIRNGLPRYFNMSVFEPVVLDSLGYTTCDYVIGLGFGIHFAQWSKSAFEDKLEHIINALSRLRSRCPGVPIFVKGPHMSGSIYQFDKTNAISLSDYIVKEMAEMMKKEFTQIDVLFIDTWDLNVSYPSLPKIHMPESAYTQELFMALSGICKDSS